MDTNVIVCGDVLDKLSELPDGCVHCVVTSPPYWGLRDYGTAQWEGGDAECGHCRPHQGATGERADRSFTAPEIYKDTCGICGAVRIDSQLGLEKTPQEYIDKMVAVFREVKRVLREDGTLWLNMGDSYASHGAGADGKELAYMGDAARQRQARTAPPGLKPKDLCGIPWQLAFALRDDGWYLRCDIIWAKPNPMPESCRDRPTKAHEYLFLLTKSPRYFYDAEAAKEPHEPPQFAARQDGARAAKYHAAGNGDGKRFPVRYNNPSGRNRRSVWTIPTAPYPEAHFATFPPKLVEPCIKAGTSEKGCCPECGAPWERVISKDRQATRPGKTTKIKVPGGWETGKAAHGSFHREGRGEPEYRDVMEVGNRDPGRHVTESQTIGWRPGCECYGLEIIEDQPTKGREESNTDFERRLTEWHARWSILSPQYQAQIQAPCLTLDPFMGSGTVGMVAAQLGRDYIGIELNPEYVQLAEHRIAEALNPTTYTRADTPEDSPLFGQETHA